MGLEQLRVGRIRIRHGQNSAHQEQESGADEPIGPAGHHSLRYWVRAMGGSEQYKNELWRDVKH